MKLRQTAEDTGEEKIHRLCRRRGWAGKGDSIQDINTEEGSHR